MNKVDIHKQLCDGLNELYAAKNHDYGDSFSDLRKKFPDSILIRLYDKLNRLETLMSGKQAKVKDESITDTLRDIANYALMELVERRMDDEWQKDYSAPKKCPYVTDNARCMAQKAMPECDRANCPIWGEVH